MSKPGLNHFCPGSSAVSAVPPNSHICPRDSLGAFSPVRQSDVKSTSEFRETTKFRGTNVIHEIASVEVSEKLKLFASRCCSQWIACESAKHNAINMASPILSFQKKRFACLDYININSRVRRQSLKKMGFSLSTIELQTCQLTREILRPPGAERVAA